MYNKRFRLLVIVINVISGFVSALFDNLNELLRCLNGFQYGFGVPHAFEHGPNFGGNRIGLNINSHFGVNGSR